MPRGKRAKGQRIGPFATFRTFVGVLREISFDEVRDEAQREPLLLAMAADEAAALALARALVGETDAGRVATAKIGDRPDAPERFDAIVVHDPARSGAATRLKDRIPSDGPAPVFPLEGDRPDAPAAIEALRRTIVTRLPDRAPAFGRAYQSFREAAVKATIDETAKANAQFALVSNIPAVIPLVGSLAAASADFLVLTKNQAILMFKIAAIHGRDLHDQWGIMRELLPVVGAGLFWRTVAREAASFVPLAAGTIPKVVIAYAGTISVGRAADFYYTTSRRPSRDQLQGYYRQAAEAVKRLPLPIPGQGGNGTADDPTTPIQVVGRNQDPTARADDRLAQPPAAGGDAVSPDR